jgi:ribose transport system ATP-binding protein
MTAMSTESVRRNIAPCAIENMKVPNVSSNSSVLQIEHLSKTFPGQVALTDVGLDVAAGEVHALVGQNGSGKSTLIKVLAGYHQPDPGSSALVSGKPFELGDGRAAAAAGIRFVHQDLGLVDAVSTTENLALGSGYRGKSLQRINWASEHESAQVALTSLGFPEFDVRSPVAILSPAQKTVVAIARALTGWDHGAKLLVLDEPTASLPGADVERLFEVVKGLRNRGVSILYVSHHLDEVFELADRVTVLRDSRHVTTDVVKTLDHNGLVERIIGRKLEVAEQLEPSIGDAPVLSIRDLVGGAILGADIDVRPGEIVGITGITGSGRESLVGLLSGQLPRTSGTVRVHGKELPNFAPRAALDAGLAFVPADRATRGVLPTMSVRENLSICDVSPHFVGGRMSSKSEISETEKWIGELSIKTSSTESPIMALSGGNQQKVMFGKALRLDPQVLVLDEPTQGIDIGAKDQIHSLIEAASANSIATIISSSDVEELVRLCHRVVVMVEGRIGAVLQGAEVDVARITHAQLQTARGGQMNSQNRASA